VLLARPILALLSVFGVLAVIAVLAAVVIGVLAATGGGEPPDRCRNTAANAQTGESRPVENTPDLAAQWQERWDAFNAQLDAGQATTVVIDESEASSRATAFVEDTDAPLDEVIICFYDGEAEARAQAEVPTLSDTPLFGGLLDTHVKARGRIELGGEHPRIRIQEIDAGSLPGFLADVMKDDIEDLINDRLARYTIGHGYTVTFRETQMEVAGTP
jgi:hypothetical protein